MGKVIMTIGVKIESSMDALELIDDVISQLADGYFEGSCYRSEFFRVLDFKEEFGAIKINLLEPSRDEMVRTEDEWWEKEGHFCDYEDYHKTATRDWGLLPVDYKLKGATREEVLDYVIETMKDIHDNYYHELRIFNKDKDKVYEELMSALTKARESKSVKVRKVKK